MIKILQIGLSKNTGGVETCITNYVKHLNHNNFQVDFADIYGDGTAFSEELEKIGCNIYKLPNYKKHPVKMCTELKDVLIKNNYNLVHINLLSAANLFPVIISKKYCNGRVIVHSHNASVPSNMVRRVLNSINVHLLRKMDVEKWACGEKAGKWMWGDEFDSNNIIENAIDINRFGIIDNNAISAIKREIGFDEDAIIIGFIGHLVEQKNVFFLPEILKQLNDLSPNYRLLLIGSGPLEEELRRKFIEFQLDDKVFWAGNRNNIENWYHIMDVFILPSKFEGLPVVGVEAQATGIPCLFSDQITREIKLTDLAIFLPICKGPEVWAKEINDIITNKNIENDILFPDRYNIEYAVKSLEKRYIDLVKK